ncbi:non-ribosomal peptide synthetase, partial [Streptomyces pacificus]|uniref:non-ribosomal peptide synthetase n=1 Tax=Streptomyces pacificus TaxID=2705029 RepID=UPI001563BC98
IAGPFDEDAFRDAVARVVRRHPVLRTSFNLADYSEPLQLVHPTAEMPFSVSDLRGMGRAEQEEAVAAHVLAERGRRFDHERPLLLRFAVHRLTDDVFQWTVTEHHAIFDGWSLHSSLAEIAGVYQQLLAGEEPDMTPPRSAYRDFIAAEKRAVRSEESERFWLDRVADRPDCRLPRWPAERPSALVGRAADDEWREHNEAEGYGSVETLLPQDVCDGLQEFAKRCKVPFKSVVLAAHLRVISLVSGSSDVLVGLTANGRLEEADGAEARGLFLNTVPFRLRLPDGDWTDLVRAVFAAERELLPHRRYPLGALQRRLGGGPLFEVNFVYNHFHVLGRSFGEGRIRIDDGKIDSFSTVRAEPTNFPLNVGVIRNPYSSRLLLGMDYHTDVLTQDQVLLMRDYYVRIMRAMTTDPQALHREVPLLGEAESALLASWNDHPAEVPDTPVHQMVEARAAVSPDAVAVIAGEEAVTYRELNVRANRLAHRLRGLGVGPDVCVGLCIERSVHMAVGLLAILKAGGAYVPLDAESPAERIEFMLTEAGAPLVLTAGSTTGRTPPGPWSIIDLDGEPPAGEQENPDNPPHTAGPDHICYVIFTSGSTGRPKGVVTLHRNVTELLVGGPFLELTEADTLLQLAPLPFDNSTFEIWAPLVGGARLVMAPPTRYGPGDIAAWVAQHQVNVLHATASLFALLVEHEPGTFDGLRRFLTGSETVSPRHAELILARCPGLELVNCWGPTETTTFSVCGVYTGDTLPPGPLPLGSPLVNTEVWVLDEAGLPVPVGTPGELHVSGPCLARGYLGSPGMTADRFGPHPRIPGARLYRTGDRGRWSVDGRVEFLGRVDHMIKIRGYRIELGEVETVLRAHPDLSECAVVARQDGAGPADLVAYAVPRGAEPSRGELRAWLGARLPKYMVPRLFVFLDALPLTARAKVDRRALPAPEGERPALEVEFVPPQGEVEEFLAGVWCRVLGLDRVGRHDDFFDLGGDSIRSIQALGQARSAGVSFGLQDLFRRPTLSGLAELVTAAGEAAAVRPAAEPFSLLSPEDRELLPAALEDAYPMAELQIGMVYEGERDPVRRPYHNVHALRVDGPFHEERFRDAVARVVRRHAVLRTAFDLSRYSRPVQLVHAEARMPFAAHDLRGEDESGRRATLARHVREEQTKDFDLAVAPLCRMAVHVLDDTGFHWTITEHHAVLDGWSLASTIAEITGVYHRLLAGEDPRLDPPRSSFRDFVAAEQEALNSAESSGYWLAKMDGRPDGRLPHHPAGRPARTVGEPLEGEHHEHHPDQGHGALTAVLPRELLRMLEEFARSSRVPFKSVVLAAHLRVMSLVTGDPDVLVGLTANGRLEETDATEVRGLFLNTVPFRLRLPEGTWTDLVQAVFDAEREQMPHRRYPMPALQRALGGGALFEASFVYNHFHQLGRHVAGDGAVSVTASGTGTAGAVARTHFPLVVAVSREPDAAGLRLEFEYDARRLSADQIRSLRGYFVHTFEEMARTPTAHHREAELLGGTERALLAEWNGDAVQVPPVLVHQQVERRAEASPEAVALVAGGETLTYGELNTRANRLAHHLRGLGVGPETAVGVCVPRSPETVVALLAVLKAGGVYVPLDPDFPAERLTRMLRGTAAAVVLTAAGTGTRLPHGPWRTLDLDTTDLPDDGRGTGNPESPVGPDNGCYVVFTSGSTGSPKGVTARHRNVTELLHGGECLTLRPDDTLLHIAPLSFDVATYELWAPLAAGARLVLAPPVRITPAAVAGWVAEHGVTVLHATASLFALLVDQEPQMFDGLRRVLTGSETVSPAHAARVLAERPRLELVNCWGPTETTTFSVCGAFTRQTLPSGPLPLGRPLANTEVWVLDDAGLPVPVGSPGELCVSGPCLARGYLGDPALTADRFVPHPQVPGTRLYRTGDRGRWSADGRVEFLGRTDHLVKVRGYRVELGEVEAALGEHGDVRACAVVAHRDPASGSAELCAYLVAEGRAPSVRELRRRLGRHLPEFMVPRRFVVLDELPLTAHGKVDRGALPAPEGERPDLQVRFAHPVGPVEQLLAGLWRRVLGVRSVGRHDDFFDLGGDSIRSIQVLGAAREAGLSFALQDLLDHPTPAGLADRVRTGTTAGAEAEPVTATEPFSLVAPVDRPLLPAGLEDAYPLAELQSGMVYEMERDPERNPYHNVETLRVSGRFDETAFRAAVARVVDRHPVLRTSFDLGSFSEPMQLVRPTARMPLAVRDLRSGNAADQRDTLNAHVRDERRRLLDLSAAPLCRMAVHILSEGAFQWTVTEHHAILDGWSLASTLTEVIDVYRLLLAGEEPPDVPVRSLYRDFVAAERAALGSAETERFWLERMAERPDGRLPRLPAGDTLPALGEKAGSEWCRDGDGDGYGALTTAVPRHVLGPLQEFARSAGVPFKSVVLAAHVRAVSVATGSTDVVIGLSSNGRLEEADGAEARGLFLNTVPFRLRLPAGSWTDLVRAVAAEERELFPHRRYPMAALRHALGGDLFEVGFVYHHFHQFGGLAEDGTVRTADFGPEPVGGAARTTFPLLVSLSREPGTDGLRLELEYDARELTGDQVRLLRDYHLRALEAMAADPAADHTEASLLGPAERGVLGEWGGGGELFGVGTVHGVVAARAAECPDAVAVSCGG